MMSVVLVLPACVDTIYMSVFRASSTKCFPTTTIQAFRFICFGFGSVGFCFGFGFFNPFNFNPFIFGGLKLPKITALFMES